MKFIKWIITIIGTMFLGMFGGQKEKGARRYGISGLAVIMGKFKPKHLVFLLLIPILSMGYGENSWLMEVLKSDFLVRIAFGACLYLYLSGFMGLKGAYLPFLGLF